MELDRVEQSAGESGIGSYFKLKTIWVNPDQILLDPRNPRLGIDSGEFDGLEEKDIVQEKVQRAVMRQIEKREHHVKDLVNSIGEKGFLDGLGSFIIKKSTRREQYLVLEGNRRTAAIKQLLRYPMKLSLGVRVSLAEIAVSEFQYINNDLFSEEQIIEILLGIIHLQGPLPWGPLEKARYIYQTYMREYKSINGAKDFTYTQSVVNKLCTIFPLSKGDVKKNLRIYRVYRQLIEAGYDVEADRYSLIEIATNDKVLREEYFEINDSTFKFSEVGVERFYTLCVESGRPVYEPKVFNKFKKIVIHGNENIIRDIEDGTYSVEEMYDYIRDEIKQDELCGQLEGILSRIQSLNVGALSEADEDCLELIERIIEMVNNRLGSIVDFQHKNDSDDEDSHIELPNTIDEALEMPDVHLKKVVIDTMRERTNKSCVKDSLIKYVLAYMEIRTSSGPRRWFNNKLNDVVKEMVYEGTLKTYKAKNVRLKLMV